jgi:hypothetical protein
MENFLNDYEIVSSAQAHALSVLFDVYKHTDACSELEPMTFGYNKFTGYYYIAFENIGLGIVLTPQNDVQFATIDFETGNEEFFNTEAEAMEALATLN